MWCPFDYKRRTRFSFMVAPDFVDFIAERDDRAERALNEKYPTCWRKFLHWLGIN